MLQWRAMWGCYRTILFFLLFFAASVVHAATDATSPVAFDAHDPDLQRFSQAWEQIKTKYVESVENKKLFENAMRGMLNGLDPHSSYLDEDDVKELSSLTTGEFAGLGIEIMPENGFLRVVTPLDDSPAKKAGILPGDLIVRVNKTLLRGLTFREAVNKLRGKPGTTVTLDVYRKDSPQLLTFKIKRAVIKIKSVKWRMLTPQYGYLRIALFQENTEPAVRKALAEMVKQAADDGTTLSGLVLDLRNNPGGLLESAIDVTNDLLDSDMLDHDRLIVYTKGRMSNSNFSAHASGDDIVKGIPIVVLINSSTASAAEIVAGALQDYHRAVIMGGRSFGKGSVQTVLPLDERSAIKLTTALYYTPAGRSIQAKGIEPDIPLTESVMNTVSDGVTTTPTTSSGDVLRESDFLDHLEDIEGTSKQTSGEKPIAVKSNEDILQQALLELEKLSAEQDKRNTIH